ncbi:MAG: hypothetical protein WCS01_11690, partial [bacterium]
LDGVPGDRWGEAKNLFFCPKCANKPRTHCMDPSYAAAARVCAVCQTPKTWSATFVEGEPMRMELHFKNLAKEERSLFDVGYAGNWSFTFTPVGGGKVWKTSWAIEDERTEESYVNIRLGVGQQDAVEMGLERHHLMVMNPDEGRQPANPSLPPGKYTVTASYVHPGRDYVVRGNPDACAGHEDGKPCTYWRGTVTTGPVEIEIKADDALARFLDAAKYAGVATVAEVKALPQPGDGDKPAQLGIEWKDLLSAPESARNELKDVTKLSMEEGQTAAGLQPGDRILVTVDQRQVMNLMLSKRLDKSELNGAKWVPWSQRRQDALIAALAPGWQEGACPWCLQLRSTTLVAACQFCQKRTSGTLCSKCAIQRGTCVYECKRTIGPATRDVTFRLWAYNPTVPQAAQQPNTCRIQPGAKNLPLWVEVQNEKGATPEFMTPGGGKRFDCCKTLFYLVEGPGLSGPTPAFHGDGGARARMMASSALQKGSATGRADLMADKLFATPGTYTIRAVAGRLVSNPLKVIVEPETDAQRKARQEAEAKTQVDREQQVERERELKDRAIRERAQ